MKLVILLIAGLQAYTLAGQTARSADEEEIRKIMREQVECWNKGDIPCFMNGYWASDSLRFIGKNGMTYGWQQTLEGYRKRYPDREAMGTLVFKLLWIKSLGEENMLVSGTWHLSRNSDDLSGYFSLVWEKIEGQWKIIYDHSS